MFSLSNTRNRFLGAVAAVWLAGIIAGFSFFPRLVGGPVVVVHWSNSHLMRPMLLPAIAEEFNQAGHTTRSGKQIEVQVFRYGSAEQVDDLRSRVTQGVPIRRDLPDPTVVTPSADHWLISGNHAAGRPLVDLSKTRSIARTWIGIVTYRDMAECLGWPDKQIGFADIVALRTDPRGWGAYSCAKADWGTTPKVAYTDPTTSSTGRSVLYTLYSIAAGKPPEQLTEADVLDPSVVAYVRRFGSLVDHYMIGTIPLNSKIYKGPAYGHFFLMPEDNLIHLYQGTEYATNDITGREFRAPPITRPMVMIYPKEGSTAHNHSASFVEAPWVTPEHKEAAEEWVDFLHEVPQQRLFMAGGFRPATVLPLTDPISGRYGLDPSKPIVVTNPDRIDQAAAEAIVGSWKHVKKPGIVTFVVDTSSSMSGAKLRQTQDGVIRSLNSMTENNQVGLVTFNDSVNTVVPVGPLAENKLALGDAVNAMQARGSTALYDAIKVGIEMTDAVSEDKGAIRGVVVLTEGRATSCQTRLDDLVRMMSKKEIAIQSFSGCQGGAPPMEQGGRTLDEAEVEGAGLAVETRHPIQIFYIGIGDDADIPVCRILAEATGAECQGAAEEDLANVIEAFGRYF